MSHGHDHAPIAHIEKHPTIVEFDTAKERVNALVDNTRWSAYQYLGAADTLRQSTLANTQNDPAAENWINADGGQQLLDISIGIAGNPERANAGNPKLKEPASPFYRHDQNILGFAQVINERNFAKAQVNWAALSQPNLLAPATPTKHGKHSAQAAQPQSSHNQSLSPIENNIQLITDGLHAQWEQATEAGKPAEAAVLWQKVTKLDAYLKRDSAPTDAAKNYYDTYSRDPSDSRLGDAEAGLKKAANIANVEHEAFSVLVGEGFGAQIPDVGNAQSESIGDAQKKIDGFTDDIGRKHEGLIEEQRNHRLHELSEAQKHDRHDLGELHGDLEKITDKLAKRSRSISRKIGGFIISDAYSKARGRGTLRQRYGKTLEAYHDSINNEADRAAFMKHANEDLRGLTNKHAEWSLNHGFPSILLGEGLGIRILRGATVGLGAASLLAINLGTGGIPMFIAFGLGASAAIADRGAHKKVRGTLKSDDVPSYTGNFHDTHNEQMRRYKKDLAKEFLGRAAASTIGGPTLIWHKLGENAEERKKKAAAGGGHGGHH